jgi:GTP-binding protein
MNVNNVELEIVCGITSKLPATKLPEIAFAGKSNVGKSSLINSLINRKSLARTSSQPGKTRTINFYNVEKTLYFVDLPGYGYAGVSHDTREQWGDMIENYLNTSKQLKAIFLLVDIRHEPSANDRLMYDFVCQSGFKPIVIATKSYKINRSQLQKQTAVVRKGLEADKDTVIIPFSSVTKAGKEEIWKIIDSFIEI